VNTVKVERETVFRRGGG